MALVIYKDIADESEPEPSICIDFSNFSDSSSSIFTEDEEINNLLKRPTSTSLFNVSTPRESHNENRNNYRTASQYNIPSDRKKRKYRPYSNDNNKTIKNESKVTPRNQEIETNRQNLSPTVSVKYAQALQEIETLQIQINKLKSEHSITPLFVRRKSMQSSMIKTCLFKNTSTVLRPGQHNSTKSSLFGSDSTCMTIDIEDKSAQTENELFNDFILISNRETKEDPFLIKAETPTSNKFNNSRDPLISDSRKADKSTSTVRNFMCKFMKCPEFLHKLKTKKLNTCSCNKISPIPKVVIISPKTSENDSGNDSDFQQRRLKNFKCNTPDVERLMEDMSKCAEELSHKLNIFRNVLQTCTIQKLINS